MCRYHTSAQECDSEIWALALDDELVASVQELMVAGRQPMLESLARNRNIDCSNKPQLEHAHVNSDQCEGGFGSVDYHASRDGKSLSSAFGIAMAERMHALQSSEEIREKEAKKKKKKLKAAGQTGKYGETEVEDVDVERWTMVSYFALDEDVRHRLLDAAEMTFKEHRTKSKEQLQEAQQGKLDRQKATKEQAERKQKKAAAKFRQHLSLTRATSVAQLTRMLESNSSGKSKSKGKGKGKGKALSNAAKLEILRQQIRIRKHVNQIPHPIGPGSWLSKDENMEEMEQKVIKMVKEETYKAPPVITVPAAVPRQTPMHADSVRMELDADENERVANIQAEFDATVENGSFMALLARNPTRAKAKQTESKAPRKAKEKQQQEPSASETLMVGAQFEDDAIEWVVLKVEWSEKYNEMVVFYYDKTAVGSSEVDLEDLDDESDHVEYSSVKEVQKWIKTSAN